MTHWFWLLLDKLDLSSKLGEGKRLHQSIWLHNIEDTGSPSCQDLPTFMPCWKPEWNEIQKCANLQKVVIAVVFKYTEHIVLYRVV